MRKMLFWVGLKEPFSMRSDLPAVLRTEQAAPEGSSGGSACTRSHILNTRSNRYKLHHERFHLCIRGFFHSESVGALRQPSMDVAESPSLEAFWNMTGQGAKKAPFIHKKLDQIIFQVPFQPGLFYDFCLSSWALIVKTAFFQMLQ